MITDKEYFIQVKSGPNTMNIGMIESLNDMIAKIEERNERAFGILGMTYGTKNQISPQIRGSLVDFDNRAFIGKDFWRLLSGRDEYYGELITLIDSLSQIFINEYATSYLDLVQKTKKKLVHQWTIEYGSAGKKGLQRLIERYAK